MNWQHLIYFHKIVEAGSFSAASKQLYITSSALSKAIQNLEKYDKAFTRLFKVKKEDLPAMKYMGDNKWDSMAHMDLMSDLEEIFDIQISTVDVLDFTDYNKGKIVLGRYGVEL